MINHLIIFILICAGSFSLYANPVSNLPRHKEFVNKNLNIDHFEFFFQDSIGRLWGGSYMNGLMMFDGESFVKKTPEIGSYGIHCIQPITKQEYIVGTRSGLFLFDMKSMKVTPFTGFAGDQVLGLYRLDEQKTLVFCAYKIAELNIVTGDIDILSCWDNHYRIVQHQVLPNNSFILLTDQQGIYNYHYPAKSKEPFILNNASAKDELLLCILYDNNQLWIGSDKGLMKYDYLTQQISRIPAIEGITVKSLTKTNNGDIWVGTDNGLYVFDKIAGQWEHYLHDNKDERSLLSDCVWTVFEDANGNKWLGLDGGVSFIPQKQSVFKIKWSDLIQTSEGNRIVHILHDSHGDYWLGGINGLGYYNASTGKSVFFKMQGMHRIPHNRIRSIYEDRQGVVWIGTDGGPAWYNREKGHFVFCPIKDTASGRSAVWTYGITEDDHGNMWIATCSGGLFGVKRESLIENNGRITSSWCNFHPNSPYYKLNYGDCYYVTKDFLGNIWFSAGSELCKIEITAVPDTTPELKLTSIPHKHIRTFAGNDQNDLWGNYSNVLFNINIHNGQLEEITVDYTKKYGDINSIAICNDKVWFVTSSSVAVMDKSTQAISHILDFSNALYKTCYYDKQNNLIWLGGTDHCLALAPEECLTNKKGIHPLSIVSEVYINGRAQEVTFNDQIHLSPKENNLSFHFSTGTLIRETELQPGYYYRMMGVDDSWKVLNVLHPIVEYSYLNFGKYELEIARPDTSGRLQTVRTLGIVIAAPWYHTTWFRLVILILIIALIVAGINFYRTKTKLHIAEIDKEKTLKLSQMKMEFLSNMSHELKTPLSLIIGPVNKLLSHAKSNQSKVLLQSIQKNAMQLSALILQIINFKDDAPTSTQLNLCRVEAVEFVQSIISVHQEAFASKGIHLEFHSEKPKIYIEADLLKLESIVNNLISNSYKFTPTNGKVTVLLAFLPDDSNPVIQIHVTDTGIGIPAKDLPYIFDRFYQSENGLAINKEGSGVGLSMAKNYIVQHGGKITVASDERHTTFTVTLPALDEKLIEQSNTPANEYCDLDENPNNQLHVLIVEDNVDIARFIADNLIGMRCTVTHNGKSGLEQAQRLLPDVIVADIMMPIMDGMEMSKLIRQHVLTSTIPIILLTAKDDKQTETDAYGLGIDVFLSKPFDVSHLIARINQLVCKKAMLASQVRKVEAMEIKEVEQIQSQDEKFLIAITRCIEEHLEDSDLNVQKLGEISGYHPKQIYRRIKVLTGHTAIDYIKSIRLKKAAMLLKQKKFSVAEVMYMVGFSSYSYFSKCFSEKYGKTPKVYMQEVER